MSDSGELLDKLDALRAAGTPDTWQVMSGSDIVTGATQLGPGSYTWTGHLVAQLSDWRDDSDQEPNGVLVEDDAALIAAAVNTLPKLTAAVRAVLQLHAPDEDTETCWACWIGLDQDGTCPTVRAITAALSPADPIAANTDSGQR